MRHSESFCFRSFRASNIAIASAAALRTLTSSSSRAFKRGVLAVPVPSGASESTSIAASRTLLTHAHATISVNICVSLDL